MLTRRNASLNLCIERELTKMSNRKTEPLSDSGRPSNRNPAPAEIDARDLLGEVREATIIHAGERYRLRITANNKLILTK